MSFVISLFNVGFVNNILTIWLKAWGFSFVVAFPAVVVVSPVVRKLVSLVIIAREALTHERNYRY